VSQTVVVEPATSEDLPRVGELTAGVYVDDGLAPAAYVPTLADAAGRAKLAELLVARDGDQIVGSVALVMAGEFGEVLHSEEEAGFRMLVVHRSARRRGVGELLVTACLDRVRAVGKRRMVISTERQMTAAHRLYQRLGFVRTPGRDFSADGFELGAYVLDLQA
jgi:GNAT superfamily N-acetyltransferase